MTFKALIVQKTEAGVTQQIETLDDDRLPEGNVTVDIEYSSVNYKDGLCLTGQGGLVRKYPHVPGIDFAGTVSHSADARYAVGDRVALTGWRVGEMRWGGYASKTRIDADQLVKLPDSISTRHAMAVGTAGLTAMLALMALEAHGLTPAKGPVLVTGASGGVGSVAVAVLARLGYEVAAVTGRPENEDYLRQLGAKTIVNRADIAQTVTRPLETESWAGCIDSVGGPMLARVLGQMQYGASVAAVGLAGGAGLPATVIPFLLRGVNLLGIDSVMQPYEKRVQAWARIARDLPLALLEPTVDEVALDAVTDVGTNILKGQVTGRTIVNLRQEQE
jgi:acrylyl-CoA reductase (NADPH)